MFKVTGLRNLLLIKQGFRGQSATRCGFSVSHNSYFNYPVRKYATYRRFNGTNGPTLQDVLKSRKTVYVGLSLVGFYLYNQDEAPYTHRRRFLWIPYWLETKIGDYSYRQILYQYNNQILPENNPLYGRVSNVMNKLLTSALLGTMDEKQKRHLQSLGWRIHIIEVDPRKVPPNAFVLPNGKIFIFSSILPICENDDGLATVLSHELSHQLAHHSSEQLSSQPFYVFLSTFLYALTGISWFNDLLIAGVLQMPASREMESEADHIGCELMAKLCFNLNEAVQFWQRMNAYEEQMKRQQNLREGYFQEFFSTHPATSKRIKDIQSWLPQLKTIEESSGCHEYQFGEFSKSYNNYFRR
ncbi:uncharacterized protein PRCAT00002042001 [Priceomyces carsonii]|uniref:uncharacterized protein n=1 Tax=Priceomyces carsonii TaxID=28549 RepID=UPI002ED89800|nr:unnamed protein product [Priceomyces carsonii]